MQVPAARVVFTDRDRAELAETVAQILAGGGFTLGAHTAAFEAAFGAAHQAPHAVAVSSGTAALEIILRTLGVAGHEVVLPANTFVATAMAVLHAGGTPVLADIDPATFALSADSVAQVLTPRTKAVVVVHIGGLITPQIEDLGQLCRAREIALVEDAAHAHGSSYRGGHAGTVGVAAAFSFYPTKVITSGEGGMIVTSDERIRDEALIYRDQGKAGFLGNVHVRAGYAWRMSEFHAAIGAVHLRHLPDFLARRARVGHLYDAGLAAAPGLTPLARPAGCVTNYYKYVVLLADGLDRALVKKECRERYGVALSGEVYELPLHHQPVLSDLACGALPNAEDVCARHVCLPVHSDMSDDEAAYVVSSVVDVVAGLRGE